MQLHNYARAVRYPSANWYARLTSLVEDDRESQDSQSFLFFVCFFKDAEKKNVAWKQFLRSYTSLIQIYFLIIISEDIFNIIISTQST